MKKRSFVIAAVLISGIFSSVFSQQHTENGADQVLRGSGRVNASTLGMEIDIPLGSYPGRGINIPVSISYSSKLWRTDYINSQPEVNNPDNCIALNMPKFAENTASGWTSSLAVPYIEYTGYDNLFQDDGFALGRDDSMCTPNFPPDYSNNAYVRRIIVHLPSGETHELRMDDAVKSYPPWSICPGSNCDSNDPNLDANWSGWYYAVDSSNIKYYEDRTNNLYYLQMPDGSKYEFVNTTTWMSATVRKANKFIDRNNNYTTYNDSNGTWTDTLGRTLAVPFGLSAPTSPTTQTYAMPGLTGTSGTMPTYKFYWKKLKDSTAAESALTDFNQSLKYIADRASPDPQGSPRSSGTYLFSSDYSAWVHDGGAGVFNPIVLAEIELPTGQKYKFTYDLHARIERIYYPTGGEERFEYATVDQLAHVQSNDINYQTNFGVIDRKVYTTAGQGTPLEWTYDTEPVSSAGLKVTINSPDDTKTERFLHRSLDSSRSGTFGYDTVLAGLPYEERAYNSNNQLISKKLTAWTNTELSTSGGLQNAVTYWHPRLTQEESIIYEGTGGISTTSKYFYDGNLSYRDTPVLQNKVEQYAFVTAGSQLPANPVRSSETTYLINDPNYSGVWSYYKNQNIIGLATASVVRDGAGQVVSRSEMIFDESGYSPNVGRGNQTTARIWDSTKGAWTNSNAYIATHARYDTYGNQYESIDAKGNATTGTFDPTYHAFLVSVTTPVPDPTDTHGSNTAFQTSATYNTTTGLPLTTIDPNGLETRIEYDPATLRPLNTKTYYQGAQVGSTSEIVYHDETNNYWTKSRTQIDTNNWAESKTYFDGLGRAYKSEQIDLQGNIFVEKEFDAEGRVKRVTNPFRSGETRQWTTNIYDEASRIKEITMPDGTKIVTDYGVSTSGVIGVTKQITDQAGKKRKGISDALGRMVRVIEDPAGQNLLTDYLFDTLGNLRKTIQGDQSRYFSHDSLSRLLFAKQPEQDTNTSFSHTDPITGNTGWSVKYEYDNNNNIVKTTDAAGISAEGTFDNLDRLRTKNYSDSTPDVDFFYDGKYRDIYDNLQIASGGAKGKTTGVKSSVSKTNYTSFDNQGRVLTHEQITDGQSYSTAYTYNLSGVLVEETYPSGRKVRNVLNNDGELAIVQSKKNSNYGYVNYADSFSYDSAGAVTKMQLGNGKWETAVYNNRLQITQIGLGTTDDTQNLLKLEYTYNTSGNFDNNGNMRSQKISFTGLSQPFEQTYSYDSLNRLQDAKEMVGATETWKQTFSYDRYGNRRFDAANTTTLGSCTAAVCNPTINTSNNRFSSGQGYSYNANGSLAVDGEGKQFFYDAENHQKEVKNSSNQTIGLYLYDGEGKRVKKITLTETTIFIYNASTRLVAEYSTQLAQTPQVSFLTTDHLGSPRIITDQNGTVTKRQDFSAFGDETITAQRSSGLKYTTADEIRKDYTGYEKDDESGLEFAQLRYYNPTHGRFTSVDPLTASASIKNPQTFNRYSYVLNSPYKFVDPLGLISVDAGSPCGTWCTSAKYGGWTGGMGFDSLDGHSYNPADKQKAAQAAQNRQIAVSGGTEAQQAAVYAAIHRLGAQSSFAAYILDQFRGTGGEATLKIEILDDATFKDRYGGVSKKALAVTESAGGDAEMEDENGNMVPVPGSKASVLITIKASAIKVENENNDRAANRETQLEAILGHELGHALDISNYSKASAQRSTEDKRVEYDQKRNERFANTVLMVISFQRAAKFGVNGFKTDLRLKPAK